MKRTAAFIPLAVILFITAIVSCTKNPPPSPSSQNATQGPLAYFGGNNWNTLYYFGTPDSYYGCVTPCGMCNIALRPAGYNPNTNDPENNEALAELSAMSNGHLLISVDMHGIGNYYLNDIITTQRFNVAVDRIIPQELVDAARNGPPVSVPGWGGPVGIIAGNYPVNIDPEGTNSRFEIEGTYAEAAGWSWEFSLR